MYNKAQAAHNKQQFQEAINIYKGILKITPENAIVQYELGVAYVDAGEDENVLRQVEILVTMGRDDLYIPLERLHRKSKFHLQRSVR